MDKHYQILVILVVKNSNVTMSFTITQPQTLASSMHSRKNMSSHSDNEFSDQISLRLVKGSRPSQSSRTSS
jgi:hypothetical protein